MTTSIVALNVILFCILLFQFQFLTIMMEEYTRPPIVSGRSYKKIINDFNRFIVNQNESKYCFVSYDKNKIQNQNEPDPVVCLRASQHLTYRLYWILERMRIKREIFTSRTLAINNMNVEILSLGLLYLRVIPTEFKSDDYIKLELETENILWEDEFTVLHRYFLYLLEIYNQKVLLYEINNFYYSIQKYYKTQVDKTPVLYHLTTENWKNERNNELANYLLPFTMDFYVQYDQGMFMLQICGNIIY